MQYLNEINANLRKIRPINSMVMEGCMFMVPPECNEKCEAYLGGGRNRTAIFYHLYFASFVQLKSQQRNSSYIRQITFSKQNYIEA